MDLELWTRVLREFGYPALFTVGTAFAWSWIIRKMTPPAIGLLEDHRALIAATTKSVEATGEVQRQTAREIEKIAGAIRDLATAQAQTFRTLEQHHDWSRSKLLELEIGMRDFRRTVDRPSPGEPGS